MQPIALLIIVLIFVAAGYGALFKPKLLVVCLLFFVGWHGFSANIGVSVYGYQLFLILLFIRVFSGGRSDRYLADFMACFQIMKPLLVWAAIVSIGALAFLPDVSVEGGFARQPIPRAILQILVFFLNVLPFFVVGVFSRIFFSSRTAIYLVINSVLVLVLIGYFQIVWWELSGYNPIPINYIEGLFGLRDAFGGASFEFMRYDVKRMNSLGGEPKNLGATIIVGILLVQHCITASDNKKTGGLITIWFVLFAAALLTVSTTTNLLYLVATVVQLILALVIKNHYGAVTERSRNSGNAVWGIVGFFILAIVTVLTLEAFSIPIFDLIIDRTFDRIEESATGIFEDFDAAVVALLIEKPWIAVTGAGLGNIHLFADKFLIMETAEYAASTVFGAKAFYLKIISELGIIGLTLFLSMIWSVVKYLLSTPRLEGAKGSFGDSAVLILTLATVFFAATSIGPLFYALLGICWGEARSVRLLRR